MRASTAPATVALPRTTAAPRRRRRAETLAPGARIGGWKIERELGRGGMATVYAVVHTSFGKRAALKLMHRESGSAQLTPDMFRREARIVNTIDHPGVADVFATGTYDGRPYIVMDRLAGKTLSELARARKVERPAALAMLGELCEVLAAAHAAGIVHRDLKLANVIVLDAPCAMGRTLKLIDWGVAAVTGEADPLTGMIAGTLSYVAPEQIRGEGVTAATDVYSLGVLAYELLTSEPPFAAVEDVDLLKLHLRETPPDPWSRWIGCPEPLAAIMVRMLAKQPVDRPDLWEVMAAFAAARAQLAATPTPVLALGTGSTTALPAATPAPALAAEGPSSDVLGRPMLPFALARRVPRWLAPGLAVAGLAAAVMSAFIG